MWKFADLIEKEAHDLAIVETLVSALLQNLLYKGVAVVLRFVTTPDAIVASTDVLRVVGQREAQRDCRES